MSIYYNFNGFNEKFYEKYCYLGKCLRQNLDEYIVVDLETTGLTYSAEIIEICALRIKNGEIIDKYYSLVDYPMRKSIPKKITELTGITIDMMREEGAYIEDVLKHFLNFVGNTPILCHNAQFDIGFLITKIEKYLGLSFNNNFIDTLYISREILKENIKNHKLITIANYLDIDAKDNHKAEKDCLITYQIYEYLKINLPNQEQVKAYQEKLEKGCVTFSAIVLIIILLFFKILFK